MIMKTEYVLSVGFLIIGLIMICASTMVYEEPLGPTEHWCTTQSTALPPQNIGSMLFFVGASCVVLSIASFLYGVKDEKSLIPLQERTQTVVPDVIQEKWFVNDWNESFQVFDSEEEAHAEFLKIIDQYREEAAGDEWNDDVERVTWGKVFQTAQLMPVDNPNNEDLLPDDPDWDGTEYADAFAIEHRRK
jgi:hypothetical protein